MKPRAVRYLGATTHITAAEIVKIDEFKSELIPF